MTLSCLRCIRCEQNAQHLNLIPAFVLDGLVLLTEVKIVESTQLCNHEVSSVVLISAVVAEISSWPMYILYLEVVWDYFLRQVWCHTRCLLW